MTTASSSTVAITKLHPLARGIPPAWAREWGDDRYGPWCAFRVKGARQRLRWIPPGRFQMGSPPGEPGRLDQEGPQRTVWIPEGFWLFDTPCTQNLWEAVMGNNPSQFRSLTRPVETVSWGDCQEFVQRLNGLLEGLALSLPSEAQWEYACRAGTITATYAGDLEILGSNNAPALDPIAWYGGNCGVEFELIDGADISDWQEKQYDLKKGGTHPVGGKAPNGFGLYDMLGNVWEWCLDASRMDGEARGEQDSVSAYRVIRGGSWSLEALYVRAAGSDAIDPGLRNGDLGFRCAEFQSGEVERVGEWA